MCWWPVIASFNLKLKNPHGVGAGGCACFMSHPVKSQGRMKRDNSNKWFFTGSVWIFHPHEVSVTSVQDSG